MKPLLKKSLETLNQSYIVRNLKEAHFDPNWHFHPHYQLFTVVEGSGTRFIGDDIRQFEAGDTVFLAPNMPHLWRSDRAYFERDSSLQTQGIVVYFTEDFLGKDFFEKPEMYAIKQLLASSERGLDLSSSHSLKTIIINDLIALEASSGFEGILRACLKNKV